MDLPTTAFTPVRLRKLSVKKKAPVLYGAGEPVYTCTCIYVCDLQWRSHMKNIEEGAFLTFISMLHIQL